MATTLLLGRVRPSRRMEVRMSSRKKEWILTRGALDRLLALFDADTERAAEKYELTRSKLERFFRSRGCSLSDELADEVMNRIARRVDEGEEIRLETFADYFYGFAHNVLREFLRSPQTAFSSLDTLLPAHQPSLNPDRVADIRAEKEEKEQRLECLESCVSKLPPETRALIVSYYAEDEGAKIASRKRMAEEMQIPINALRIRAHRIRSKLEKCITECLNQSEDEMD